eukprot:gene27624-36357_t
MTDESFPLNPAIQIVECLYKRSVFQGFRRPVTSMYPSLSNSYKAAIKTPMDLGSLLLFFKVFQMNSPTKVLNKLTEFFPDNSEFITFASSFPMTNTIFFQWFKEKLQLISSNSLKFNMGSPSMEAISQHLNKCAGALFENTYYYPYNSINAETCVAMQSSNLQSLIKRFFLIQYMPLMLSELELLVENLKKFDSATFDETIRMAAIEMRKINDANESGCVGLHRSTFLLKDFLSAIPEFSVSNDHYILDSKELVYVVLNGLSTLMILLEERFLRGITYSCIWARPAETFVWARPSHSSSRDSSFRPRVNWFPGMVIAAGHTACVNGTAGLAPQLMLNNLSRMPADLQAELLKIRPRPILPVTKKKEAAGEDIESEGEQESIPTMPSAAVGGGGG